MIEYELEIKGKHRWIIIEKHADDCKCSYCEDSSGSKLKYGFNIPENINETSWGIIKFWNRSYYRFTLGKFWKYVFKKLKK